MQLGLVSSLFGCLQVCQTFLEMLINFLAELQMAEIINDQTIKEEQSIHKFDLQSICVIHAAECCPFAAAHPWW